MAENAEQTKKDALYLLDALKYVTSKVEVNAGEFALSKNVQINSIETRFSAIRARHDLKISTTTNGFRKQKPSTPKKLIADSQVKAIEGPAEGRARSARTPKPSARKRQADEYGMFDDEESSPSKRHNADRGERKEDYAAWDVATEDHYDGVYVLDGARGVGY